MCAKATPTIAVLAAEESWYLRDLMRAAQSDFDVVGARFSQLASHVGSMETRVGDATITLDQANAVIVRSMPPGSLEQIIFRMDTLAVLERRGVFVCNPPKSLETAIDKYLTLTRLAEAGLQVPETYICQTTDEAIAAFNRLGGDVVLKPLFGSEGRGITRLQDESLAYRAFRMLEQLGAVLYLQRFIHHPGFDLRVLVIGEQMLAIRRSNALDWRTNVSRGARAEPIEVTAELAELARRATDAIGATVAGVDLLPDRDGRLWAIEVNAVPGWKAVARAHGCDVARLVLDHVAAKIG